MNTAKTLDDANAFQLDITNPLQAISMLLWLTTEVATTIRLNTPYYQGDSPSNQPLKNVMWLSEFVASLNSLSRTLIVNDSETIVLEIDNLISYWNHYSEEIEAAREQTLGDEFTWKIDQGLLILTSLKSVYGSTFRMAL